MPFGRSILGNDLGDDDDDLAPVEQSRRGELTSENVPYSDKYREACFHAWYQAGRPSGKSLLGFLPADEYGRKPTSAKIRTWRDEGWHRRADELDRQVHQEMQKYAIETRVAMLKRHADLGRQMQEKGVDWLSEHEPDKAGDAIRLVVEGVRIESDSVGVSDALLRISKMKDQELSETIGQLLNRLSGTERKELLEQGIVSVDIEDVEITGEEDA